MFITSIVMVVVLAVALTTSSLAWFSAAGSNTVTVDTFTLAANTRVSTAGLEISNDNAVWSNEEITLRTIAGATGLDPMCPTGTLATPATAVSATEFYNIINAMKKGEIENRYDATMNSNQGGYQDFFTAAAVDGVAASEVFYVRNSGDQLTGLTTSVTVTSTNSWDPMLWVAVFDITDVTFNTSGVYTSGVAAASVAQPKLLALVRKSGQSGDMTWTATPATTMAADAPVAGLSGIDPTKIALTAAGDEQLEPKTYTDGNYNNGSNKAHKLVVYAWFDGSTLVNANGGAVMTIDISFDIANPTQQNP